MSDSVLADFRDAGAYHKSHFRLTSGLHSNEYLQCALVLQHPSIAARLEAALAQEFPKCDSVASRAIGRLIIGHEVARHLGEGSIIDRSGGKVDLGVPPVALVTLNVTGGKPEDCPLCKQGVPVEKPGSRPTA